MKRTILAILIAGGTLAAQQVAEGPAPGVLPSTDSVVKAALAGGPVSFGPGVLAFQQQNASQQSSAQPAPASGGSRPRTEGSMIGYIENAIVGSHVRIRTEAGFNGEFPDRAEFFYAKCGCYQGLGGTGLPAYDPNAPGPAPGVLQKFNFQQVLLEGEFAFGRRFSLFTEIPIRWIQPKTFVAGTGSFENQAGLSDVRAGFKAALLASPSHYLTLQFKSYFPSGDASKGLGTNHYSIEPAILYYQELSDRWAVESEFGVWHPIGGSVGVATPANLHPEKFAGNVIFYGVGPSFKIVNTERVRFGPVLEVVGWNVRGGWETVVASLDRIADSVGGTNIANIKIGVRLGLAASHSFYLGYGHALTDAVWYEDTVRFEYRYSFR
jgi:Putative MetA-pathway of phenol degradation